MAQRINLPRQAIPPSPIGEPYSYEIIAPNRSSAAQLTMTRAPGGWPPGELFTYRAFERERNSGALNLLTGGTESGGPAVGKDGTVNPPLVVTLTWPLDKDRDLIRFELDVVQTFTTAITVEFL